MKCVADPALHSLWSVQRYYTRLKNTIENNSTWEGAFYQSAWVKINSSWVILVFSIYGVAADASK